VGGSEGISEGVFVGGSEGISEGVFVGGSEGISEGVFVGESEGLSDRIFEGDDEDRSFSFLPPPHTQQAWLAVLPSFSYTSPKLEQRSVPLPYQSQLKAVPLLSCQSSGESVQTSVGGADGGVVMDLLGLTVGETVVLVGAVPLAPPPQAQHAW
jgi:hypothetical protein